MNHPIENFENVTGVSSVTNDDEDLVALSVLSAASQEHELPRDRAREEIKNRVVFRGQFGIGVILIGFVLIGGLCGVPAWFGLDPYSYWIGMALLFFCFAPMISFFAMSLADQFGFPPVARRVLGIATIVLAPSPFLIIALLLNGATFSGGIFDQLALVAIWISQVIALVTAKLLMR